MQHAEGIFSCRTQTRYNAAGGLLVSVQKQLISQLSATLAEKVITINERGLTSEDWTVYNNGTKRTRCGFELSSFTTVFSRYGVLMRRFYKVSCIDF